MDQHCAKHDKYRLKSEYEKRNVVLFSTVGARQRAGGYDRFSVTVLRPAATHFSQKKLMQLENCVQGLWWVSENVAAGQGMTFGGKLCHLGLSATFPVWLTPMKVTTGADFINQQGNLGHCVLLVPIPLSCLGCALDSGGEIMSCEMERSSTNESLKYVLAWKLREMWSWGESGELYELQVSLQWMLRKCFLGIRCTYFITVEPLPSPMEKETWKRNTTYHCMTSFFSYQPHSTLPAALWNHSKI